jgi:hypothetical protein
VRDLKNKFLVIAVALMAVAMLTIPVMAEPTKGKKAAITLTFTFMGAETIEEPKLSDGVLHTHVYHYFAVELAIDDGPTYYGTAVTDRKMLFVSQEKANLLMRDNYVFSFPDQQGGFEGNAMVLLDGVVTEPFLSWEMGKAHALFKGTGAFEGQTINAGYHWGPPQPPTITWGGYLLKP